MKLRNRKSSFTNLPEGRAPSSFSYRLTRLVYFTLLLLLLAYLFHIGINRFSFFHGVGQIELERTVVSSSRGGRIAELPVMNRDTLQPNDLIARIASEQTCHHKPDIRIGRLAASIKRDELKLKQLHGQRNKLQQQKQQMLNLQSIRRALETGGDKRISSQGFDEQDLIDALNEIELLRAGLELDKEELQALSEAERNIVLPDECFDELIRAPFEADIISRNLRVNEYAGRGKPIVILLGQDAEVFLDAYFSDEVLEYLHKGKRLNLTFPDGYQAMGQVEKISSSAQASSERELDNYIPVGSDIRVKVVPLDKADRDKWKFYDRMDIKIEGSK